MERVVMISDVHSNLQALDAVLSKVGSIPVYCLGDTVGYGAYPNQVIDRLRGVDATCILGNHDSAALSGDTGSFNSLAERAALWTMKELSPSSVSFLRGLPTFRKIEVGGEPVYLTHGSPDDNLWEYVLPSTHGDLMDHYLVKLGVRLMGVGHSHVQFLWEGEGGKVFNPGSVGQPRDGDPRAAYAILEVSEGETSVSLRRVKYDVDLACRSIAAAGLPNRLGDRLYLGE